VEAIRARINNGVSGGAFAGSRWSTLISRRDSYARTYVRVLDWGK
jgi:hypothetical protein